MCLLVEFNSITAAEGPGFDRSSQEKERKRRVVRGDRSGFKMYLLCSKPGRGLIDLVWAFICWMNLIGPFFKIIC